MNPEIVGREVELSSLRAFVEQDDGRSAALVLEGEPGIGKSTLWLAGVEQARARGLRVLATRPSEAERGLAHAGLGDLFEDALDDVLPSLAPPRRRALEVALLLEDASEDPVDHRALAVAVRSALEALSEQEPVVVAVDDVQWLDPSSAGALAFALAARGVERPRPACQAARRRSRSVGARVRPADGARRDRAAQRRRRPPAAQRPARPIVCTPDTSPDPRAVGWEPVLRARDRPRARRRRRPARTTAGP